MITVSSIVPQQITQKPTILSPELDGIPNELKQNRSWVTWKLDFRANQTKPWTKVPLNARTGGQAMTNEPGTWSQFDIAVEHFQKSGVEGIGYRFSQDVVGIDLDNCRNPITGEIQEWAQKIFQLFNSYTEVSATGTGIHILCRGQLPAGRHRTSKNDQHGIEMYDKNSPRYFTMTGRRIEGNPTTLQHRQDEILKFHAETFPPPPERPQTVWTAPTSAQDEEIIRLASSHNDKFKTLWKGDWKELGYASQSDADLALANMLAFYVGSDPDRIRNLFSQSGLNRDKWERDDYSARTIRTALEREEFYDWTSHRDREEMERDYQNNTSPFEPVATSAEPRKTAFITDTELMKLPNAKWLVKGLIECETITMLYGASGSMKSFVALDLALCVAYHLPFAGKFKTRPGKVAYLYSESWRGAPKRYKALLRAKDIEPTGQILFTPNKYALNVKEEAKRLMDDLKASFGGDFPTLLIVDTLSKNYGGSENDDRDANDFTNIMEEIRQDTGASILIIHHTGKNANMEERGSSKFRCNVDGSIRVKKEDMFVTLECQKLKEEKDDATIGFTAKRVVLETISDPWTGLEELSSVILEPLSDDAVKELNIREKDEQTELKCIILDTMEPDKPIMLDKIKKTVAKIDSSSPKTVARRLADLVASGYAKRTRKGYFITTEGDKFRKMNGNDTDTTLNRFAEMLDDDMAGFEIVEG